MTVTTWLALTLVTGLGALLQGSIGFGLGLFSVPFLLLLDPRLVPGPILLASGLLTSLMLYREHPALRAADLKWSLAGRILGTGIAMAVLVAVPAHALGIVFAVLVLSSVVLSALGLHLAPAPRSLAGAGMLSGFMATTVSIGGPPMALLYQHEEGPSIRATLSAFFVVGTILSLIGLHIVGHFGWQQFLLSVALWPGIIVGFLASRHLTHRLDRGAIRPVILGVSAMTAIAILLREFI